MIFLRGELSSSRWSWFVVSPSTLGVSRYFAQEHLKITPFLYRRPSFLESTTSSGFGLLGFRIKYEFRGLRREMETIKSSCHSCGES